MEASDARQATTAERTDAKPIRMARRAVAASGPCKDAVTRRRRVVRRNSCASGMFTSRARIAAHKRRPARVSATASPWLVPLPRLQRVHAYGQGSLQTTRTLRFWPLLVAASALRLVTYFYPNAELFVYIVGFIWIGAVALGNWRLPGPH